MIKKLLNQLFSMQVMGVLVILLAVAMAVATFIEDSSGAIAAKALVYNAWWFELAILITFISILLNIFKFKLYRINKLPVFLFHFSFLVIIIGAGITRYVSNEGTMHIREGATADQFLSYETFFYASAMEGDDLVEVKQMILLSARSKNQVHKSLKVDGHKIRFKSTDYISGRQMAAQMGGGSQLDVLKLEVTVDGYKEEILIRGMLRQALRIAEYEINGVTFKAGFGTIASPLPFEIKLIDFELERYPGSNSPSSYTSEVILLDINEGVEMPYRIFMNNILKYKGYRFYQASWDQADEMGTTLSVNNDALGTSVTYLGYFLMIASILLSLFAPGSKFVRLIKDSAKPVKVGVLLLLLSIGLSLQAQNTPPVSKLVQQEAKEFGKIWVQGSDGRFEPVNTLAQELTRKIFKQNRYGQMSAEEFWLSILLDPVKWESIPLFELERPELSVILGINGSKAAFSSFFQGNQYRLTQMVDEAVKKRPNERSSMDKSIIKLDEQLNVFYLCINGQYLRIFPDLRDSHARWFDLTSTVKGLPEKDSLFINTAFGEYLNAIGDGNTSMAQKWREAITQYQEQNGSEVIPSETKAKLEILYNRMLVFERLAPFFATIGLILLIIQFLAMFKPKKWQARLTSGFAVLFGLGFILHTIGLAVRWYVSGHAPMSNGYESMIFVAWGTLLAGLILMKRSKMALALTALLAALSLLVAHLSWMSPEITPLVPVLKSPWLTIHVAVIMTSYSFLGLGALISIVVMFLYTSKTKKNYEVVDRHIAHLTKMNKIVLIVGLYLITIGCFLGAIWANVSWGRYWGWDPKETWCLISILIYSFVIHMHHIKGMNTDFSFNLGSLLSFGSILMTYFGVNYFMGGMHSYGGGAAPTIPIGIYVALILIVGVVYWAYFNQQRFEKK